MGALDIRKGRQLKRDARFECVSHRQRCPCRPQVEDESAVPETPAATEPEAAKGPQPTSSDQAGSLNNTSKMLKPDPQSPAASPTASASSASGSSASSSSSGSTASSSSGTSSSGSEEEEAAVEEEKERPFEQIGALKALLASSVEGKPIATVEQLNEQLALRKAEEAAAEAPKAPARKRGAPVAASEFWMQPPNKFSMPNMRKIIREMLFELMGEDLKVQGLPAAQSHTLWRDHARPAWYTFDVSLAGRGGW